MIGIFSLKYRIRWRGHHQLAMQESASKLLYLQPTNLEQQIHYEMRIPERDVTYIVLSVYLLTLTHRYHYWKQAQA